MFLLMWMRTNLTDVALFHNLRSTRNCTCVPRGKCMLAVLCCCCLLLFVRILTVLRRMIHACASKIIFFGYLSGS